MLDVYMAINESLVVAAIFAAIMAAIILGIASDGKD